MSTKEHKRRNDRDEPDSVRAFKNWNYGFVFSSEFKKWYRGKSKKVNNDDEN